MNDIELAISKLSEQIGRSSILKDARILIHLTDVPEEYCLETDINEARLVPASEGSSPIVRVSGPSKVIQSILEGRKEASRAFIAGGIQVQGDLPYLETLLKEGGLLHCSGE